MPRETTDIGADAARLARGFGPELLRSVRAHSIFIAIVFLHLVAALVLPPLFGVTTPYSPWGYFTTIATLTVVACAVFLVFYSVAVAVLVRPPQLWPYLWAELSGKVVTVERLCLALPTLAVFPIFAATFSYFKTTVPIFHPFAWDPTFADWDRMLHFGHDPWQLLQPILGFPAITALLSVGYRLWFGVTYGVVLWMLIETRNQRLRMRYLLTFVLTWILVGNLAATFLSSAGPAFYGRVTGLTDPFAPLLAYLREAGHHAAVVAPDIQDMLWNWYLSGSEVPGAGISAMPSMHVAMAFSFFLLGCAVNRRVALFGGLYALLIFLGSIHLGWHYAIDGYAGAACTSLIWVSVGWLLRRPSIAWLLWGDSQPAGSGATAAA